MTLVNVERIKLFSTRSPYWCLALIVAFAVFLTVIISLTGDGFGADLQGSQQWVNFGLSVVMVMAALSITTEYRFGTIRNSFLGAPKRTGVLVSKAVLLALISVVIMEVTSLLTWAVARAIRPTGVSASAFAVDDAADWRVLLGPGVIGAFAAVLAIGIGAMVRHSAAAIAIVLLWPLLVENLFLLFGDFGRKASAWLPFRAAGQFYTGDASPGRVLEFGITVPNWWQGGLIFAGVALLVFVLALALVKRRDA